MQIYLEIYRGRRGKAFMTLFAILGHVEGRIRVNIKYINA